MAQNYQELLKKLKIQFTAITGSNYSFTPAIVELNQNRKCEVYFAYNISPKKKILRPYFKLVTDYKTGIILEFKNAYYSEFADSKKYPLTSEFDAKVPLATSAKEQIELIKNLQTLYEKVRVIAFEKNLSAENKTVLSEYANALSQTIPEDLLNFCKNTEPQFFEWIAKNIE